MRILLIEVIECQEKKKQINNLLVKCGKNQNENCQISFECK